MSNTSNPARRGITKQRPSLPKRSLLAIGIVSAFVGFADSALISSKDRPNTHREGIAVTVYNDDLALVKDTRRLALESGTFEWKDVSAKMRPETALLRNVAKPGALSILEQNFDFDLLTPKKLLEKSVGKTVSVIRTHPTTGVDTVEEAKVLAANDGVVLQYKDRVETGVAGRLSFKDMPAGLKAIPTLSLTVKSSDKSAAAYELSYLTGGLGWKADYVANLSDDETTLALNGWITVTNASGTAYENAKLQVVAGAVNRIAVPEQMPLPRMAKNMAMAEAGDAAPVREAVGEYHMYSLPRPVTLADKQVKQVSLLTAGGVLARKEYVLEGHEGRYHGSVGDKPEVKLPVGAWLEFDNKGGDLGTPLPAGAVRVYKKDSRGQAQFVGEDSLGHTPKGEKVRLKLGDSFDLTANRKQVSYERISSGRHGYSAEMAHEITVKNAKQERVRVKVRELIPGDWKMLSESQVHTKESSRHALWTLDVPAEGSMTLTYKVRVQY